MTITMKYIYGTVVALLFVGVVLVPGAHAETSVDVKLEQIKMLMAKLEELKKQLATIRGEVKAVIKDGLKEGMTDEDIKKVQELLATDATIYPEGKVTGYFGPLTREAVKRFQTRHELKVTGVLDEETQKLLEEYLHESFGDRIPPGLLRAPGIAKKVELRFKEGCDNRGTGVAVLCKKLKVKYEEKEDQEDEDDESEDEHEDEDEDNHEHDDGFDVELEIEDGETTLEFEFDGEDYEIEVDSDELDDILDAVADELDEDSSDDLDEDLVDAIEHTFEEATDDDDTEADEDGAEDAIEDAEDAIEDAEDAIEDADGDTDDAEELLDQAQDKLNEAEDALDDEDFEDAEDLALEAKDLAEQAIEAL